MKIVINRCFGGFGISESCARALGVDEYFYNENELRTNERFIAMVEEDSDFASGKAAELEVVEIPDNATDWDLTEYDGAEGIIYVVDGKIYYI